MSKDVLFDTWSSRTLSVLRIVAAFLFTMHGTAKLFGVPHQPQFDNLQLISLEGLQGILEFAGGMLLLVGLFSRPVAFILSGDMAVAYFMAHFPKNWLPILNGGDLAVLFCFVFFYLWLAGSGPWSIDAMIKGATQGKRYVRSLARSDTIPSRATRRARRSAAIPGAIARSGAADVSLPGH